MKKLLTIACLVVLVSGCATKTKIVHVPVPVAMQFPEAPVVHVCPALQLVPPNTKSLHTVIEVVAANYARYHECSAAVDAWNTWHAAQRRIREESQ